MRIFALLLFQYIDPGSMGVIAQIAYIALISVGTWFLLFFKGSKNFFNRLRGKKPPAEEPPVQSKSSSEEKPTE